MEHAELFSAGLPRSVCLHPQVAGAGDPTQKRPAKGYLLIFDDICLIFAFTQIYFLIL